MNQLIIKIIQLYQRFFRPLLPKACRYYPSCSEYAILSFEKFGFWKGSFKAVWRILRCHPFALGGYDTPT